MALQDLMLDSGPDVYYSAAFRNVLEDHMVYLRNHPQTSPLLVDPGESYQWRNDLFGLLSARAIPAHFHWMIMRLNNYTSPTQFIPNTVALLCPNFSIVEKIRQSHKSTARIS